MLLITYLKELIILKQNTVTETGRIYEERQNRIAFFDAAEEELMTPVRAKLEQLKADRNSALEEYASKISESLKSLTFEDFLDPVKAKECYEAAWSLGYGIRGYKDFFKNLFADCYVQNVENRHYGPRNSDVDTSIYTMPILAIPPVKDADKLAVTAEKVEAIYRVNKQITGDIDPIITVFSSDLQSHYIVFDSEDQLWKLVSDYSYYTRDSAENLIDLLWITPTYDCD